MNYHQAQAKARRLQAAHPDEPIILCEVEVDGGGWTWDAATDSTFQEWDELGYVGGKCHEHDGSVSPAKRPE